MEKAVQVLEGSLTLPTYAIKGENRNPVFRSQYGVAHIYPYTLLDDIESTSQDRTYHVLILENKYLRVTVITDLGGRVYSVFDKVSQREVFYKNSIVRFAPLAIRGAFFSGGVEFSFPVAHAPTTTNKVNWEMRQNEDGSASVFIGGLEHLSGLRWMITLTLFPDRCALAQDVYLYNPGSLPGRYHYWTNASLDANEGTEFIYPLHRVRSYEYAGSASWPFARLDLIQDDPGLPGMEGVPMWPARQLLAPVNFRWQKHMLAQVSIFGRDVSWDYFGAWQHHRNHGFAHVAKSRDVSGMKLWSWGNAPVGVVNQTALTDDGSLYAETQCGALETQLDFDFLRPGEVRSWREWWIPLREIGGITCASETVGARVQLITTRDSESIKLRVALCPVMPYAEADVIVKVADQLLLEKRCSFSPEVPWIQELTMNPIDIADKPIMLVVTDALGGVLLQYTLSRDTDTINVIDTEAGLTSEPADDFYKLGLKQEKLDNREQARESYQKALHLDNAHREAHFRLGLILLRSAQFEDADTHFARSSELGLSESSYYRGMIALSQARLADAEAHFKAGQSSESHHLAAALAGLGKLALHKKDWGQAIAYFDKAGALPGEATASKTLMAIALRRAGKLEEARTELQRVIARDPLNHPALYEISAAGFPESVEYRQKLERILSDDDQYSIDLACYYAVAGLFGEALEILKAAWLQKENAMTAYLAAFLSHQIGDEEAELSWLGKARAASPDFGFPSRLEEVRALQSVLKKDTWDAKAKYLLGNFFFAHERYEEAIQLWTEALGQMDDYDVLSRNLGMAAWQRHKNLPEAIKWFEKALALNLHNQDLYLHLDELYKSSDQADQRALLLERINMLTDLREDVRKRRIQMMVELGHYQEAIEIMTEETFLPLEMDQSFHEIYVQALMLRAKDHLKSGQIDKAIADYHTMLEYPSNHGVGAPTNRTQAHIYYELGLAYEKLGRYSKAIESWWEAAREHHPHGSELFVYVQRALDKLSRYSELGLEE